MGLHFRRNWMVERVAIIVADADTNYASLRRSEVRDERQADRTGTVGDTGTKGAKIMLICYRDKKFRNASLKLINTCNAILDDFAGQGFELTLRQLYYQLVAKAIILNNERSYDNLGALISDARLAGLVDWDAIVDRTRNVRGLPHWNTPADIIKSTVGQFNLDLWAGQPHRMEVWVEKDALVDITDKACTPYDVKFFSCRGYTSQSEMWGASQRLMRYAEDGAERVTILHLGDHDPSGLDMTRDITERLELFCEHDGHAGLIDVQRIALNMDQIRQYNPPPNPAKLTDCRAEKYIAEHGSESWELDALNPKVITDLIRKHINDGVENTTLFKEQKELQDAHRAELEQIADSYDTIMQAPQDLSLIREQLELAGFDTVADLDEAFHAAMAEAKDRNMRLEGALLEIRKLKAKLKKGKQ